MTYTKTEITCGNVIFFLLDFVFFLFPPLRSLVPGYVIKDAVEENYESDHDYPH